MTHSFHRLFASYLLPFLLVMVTSSDVYAQEQQAPQGKLSTRYGGIDSMSDFRKPYRAQGTCLLPFGILEKHGPHLPLGTVL